MTAILFLEKRAERAFMAIIAIQAVIVIAMVASTFHVVSLWLGSALDSSQYKTLPCYLALFILAEIFEVVIALDALYNKNIIQVLGIIIFHCGLLVFTGIQIHETNLAIVPCTLAQCTDDTRFLFNKVLPFLVITPCAIAASWFLLMYYAMRLFPEYGWLVFHMVGASPVLKSMRQWYEIFICLLKFDFFCFVGVTMQLLIVVLTESSAEFGITIAAIPVVLILLAGCTYAVKREIRWIMALSLILMVAAMSYFLYKLVRFYEPSSSQQYLSTRVTLTVFTIVAFLLVLASFLVGVKCFYNFGNGLHDHADQNATTIDSDKPTIID